MWIGEASGAASCADSRRKLPGGDWSRGTPALSSTRTPQRSSSAATRRPRPRLVVTSAARLPGVSSASRRRKAMRTASAAGSGAASSSTPAPPAASSARSCARHRSSRPAGSLGPQRHARGRRAASRATAGRHPDRRRSAPSSRLSPNCGWPGRPAPRRSLEPGRAPCRTTWPPGARRPSRQQSGDRRDGAGDAGRDDRHAAVRARHFAASASSSSRRRCAASSRPSAARIAGQAVRSSRRKISDSCQCSARVSGHQAVQAVELDLLVVQLVEKARQLRRQPHRLLVRHRRVARPDQAGQQQPAPERRDRRRQRQLDGAVERQLALVRLAHRDQTRQQQRLAAAARRNASRAARQARRLGSSRGCRPELASRSSSPSTSAGRNGRPGVDGVDAQHRPRA